MGDDFNFFLPDELLNDSDSEGENSDPSSRLPPGFVSTTAAPDFTDPDFTDPPGSYPAQSRLLSNITSQGLRPGASHR